METSTSFSSSITFDLNYRNEENSELSLCTTISIRQMLFLTVTRSILSTVQYRVSPDIVSLDAKIGIKATWCI